MTNELLSKVEAACLLGVGVELLEWFTKRCPKPKQTPKRKLPIASTSGDGEPFFDREEVLKFAAYLNDPWPKPPKGDRPNIPDQIKDDIAKECHHGCAICGLMMKGEVAHIFPVVTTLNNSPDNLIFLCPNHHTQYDYGFKPASNVTLDVVLAAKRIKQNSRRRIMRFEENAIKVVKAVIGLAKQLERDLKNEPNSDVRQVQISELKSLLQDMPAYLKKAEEQAAKDQPADQLLDSIIEQSSQIAKSTLGITKDSSEDAVRLSASQLAGVASEIELDLDEVECPHCGGSGITGLVGNYCSLCGGRTVVSEAEANEHSTSTYKEVECPRCHGRGTTGLTGDYCSYCRGDCFVDRKDAEHYDPSQLDEVECPHCEGRGLTGRVSDYCAYCGGSCVVSREEADNYDRDKIDEVECPHCGGSGIKGRSTSYCSFCGGSCVVSREEADNYDRDKIDEVECPRCHGSGMKGVSDDYCDYCEGACVVSTVELDAYDEFVRNEVECPHCEGRGWVGNSHCGTCGGACRITTDEAAEYEERRGREIDCPHCEGTGVKGLLGETCNLCHGEKSVTEEVYEAYLRKKGQW